MEWPPVVSESDSFELESGPKYGVGRVLTLISPKTGQLYRVKVMGAKVVTGEHAGGRSWYYGLSEVGSKGRLLRGRSLVAESWLDEHVKDED